MDIAGEQLEVSRYEYARDKLKAIVSVDDKGRIVMVEQGFMVYELVDWTEKAGQEE